MAGSEGTAPRRIGTEELNGQPLLMDWRTFKHELRTPINHIIGYSELLAESAQDCGDTEGVQQAVLLREHGQFLWRTIQGKFLSYSDEVMSSHFAELRSSILPAIQAIVTVCAARECDPSCAEYAADLARIRKAAQSIAAILSHRAG